MKKYVNRLRRNCKIRNACFAHAHFRLFFLSAYAAAAAAAHSAHGCIVVHLYHQWFCFIGQTCRFFKKSRSYRKIFFFIDYTKVFHSRTRSIQGAPTLLSFMCRLFSAWHYSHPPLLERLAALKAQIGRQKKTE